MKIKEYANIPIEDTEEYSEFDVLLENLKKSALEAFDDKMSYLSTKYQNIKIIGVSIHTDDDNEENDSYSITHYYQVFSIAYERDETEKEVKKRIQNEEKMAKMKEKERAEKKALKEKMKSQEYETYLKLKEKFER